MIVLATDGYCLGNLGISLLKLPCVAQETFSWAVREGEQKWVGSHLQVHPIMWFFHLSPWLSPLLLGVCGKESRKRMTGLSVVGLIESLGLVRRDWWLGLACAARQLTPPPLRITSYSASPVLIISQYYMLPANWYKVAQYALVSELLIYPQYASVLTELSIQIPSCVCLVSASSLST